jgi:methyl-accepting chemotaxis protein
METRFTILLVELGVALVLEIGILVAILLVVKKSTARMEALANEVQKRAVPTLEALQAMVETTRPQLEGVAADLAASTATLRQQMERLDTTVNDAVDRTRLQIIRADEIVSRTMDRVEETTELVHHTVVSPVRQLSALIQGISVALQALLGDRRRPRERMGVPQDEMFI